MHSRGTVMSKPMGSEWAGMLISRLLLLNFLLLWQLGTGTTSGYGTKAAADNGNATTFGLLAADEGSALRLLIDGLQSKETIVRSPEGQKIQLNSYCSNKVDAQIKCSCDNSNEACSITAINFRSKMLDGFILFSAGNFKNLEVLVLSNNQLSGRIPSELANLRSLKKLDLRYNALTGSIPPNLTNLHSLEFLFLSGNMLTGSIPESLRRMRSLIFLDLSENNLEGVIPQNLTGLQSLRYLDLSRNKLSGPIPDSIADCQNLVFIILRLNILNGTTPPSLGKIPSLLALDLYSNSLSGQIPPELGKLSALFFLNLDDNNLEGNLPKELGNLVNLTDLYLTSNKFNGSIPDTFAKLIHLEQFVVGGNNLSGSIPNYFGKWGNLTKLTLIGNNFDGKQFDLAGIFKLPKLQSLLVSDLSNPGISIPTVEVISESLIYVVLRNCKINGSIPEYVGKWPLLSYLDLSFNNLTGEIPESFQNLTDKLLLSNNSFTKLPSWIIKPNGSSNLKTDLSYNNFHEACNNTKCLGLENVNIHPTRSFIASMQNETCHRKHNFVVYKLWW